MKSEIVYFNNTKVENHILNKIYNKNNNLTIVNNNTETHLIQLINVLKENEKIIISDIENVVYSEFDKYSLVNYLRIKSLENKFDYEISNNKESV